MKRKSGRKVPKPEDDTNGVEDKFDENGGGTDNAYEENIEAGPKEKKRKSSKSSKRNVSSSPKKNEAPESDPLEDTEDLKKSKDKKKKVREESSEDEVQGDEDDETQYEVEKIIEEKMIKGVRHYLIRWKGYEQESDTWEPEDTLNCPEIIADFKEKKKTKVKKDKLKKKVSKDDSADWDENEDFEVERIIEVHHKRDGKREFLVSWKGYSSKDNSWEPEENMNCKDLIEKFMAKVETAKSFEEKDLRLNRKHVQRLTYNTPESNRRLSKRMSGKERVQYHEADE